MSSNLYSSIANRITSLWPWPAAMRSIVWPWLVAEWSRECILGARYCIVSTWPPQAALWSAFHPSYKKGNNKWTHDWKCILSVCTRNDRSKQTCVLRTQWSNQATRSPRLYKWLTEWWCVWREWGRMLHCMETCCVCSIVTLCKCKLHLVSSVHWAALPNNVFHFVKISFLSCS